VNEPARIRRALEEAETIAVVGCSPDPSRASHAITRYLLGEGYRVVPVNPNHGEILGQRCYPSLSEIPADVRIDIVDVFRRPEHVQAIAREAMDRGVPFVFLQLGVVDADAARRMEERGIGVAMDRCILVEHERLGIPPKSRNETA
jgi:predicted CoA-binding protein